MPEIEALEQAVQDADALLRKASRALAEAHWELERTNRKCWWCGRTDEQNNEEFGTADLIEIRIQCNVGEEGHTDITRLMCHEHLMLVQEKVSEMGIASHAHGSTTLLEDMSCPGYHRTADCPKPEPQYPE